ncbi:MAG: sigma-54-dependent Fis family transcriptional regulator [Alphaproteobacteria bacterium]|nr:sigma-54-dependent Fis family transcriptional regulator [Alphaproteobacteria bacterium]MBV8547987.1 sigma-54-dependent Fis family transcriptional regulator [Alphaproteobacteria bacterium]
MRLLIVGQLAGHISTAGRIATQRGAKVAHIDTVAGALNALRNGQGADLVMCDIVLDIAELIGSLKSERINVPVVACGIGTDAGAAVRAIRAGAKEYVPLPPDAELIAAVLQAVAEEDSTFIARDRVMQPIMQLAERVANSDASILVTGESGTGKEVMARFVHRKSRRANANFVSVNCAAIPDNLLESELFGHEKGAFTGAVARRIGKFEEANGGTLLLDEISEMDLRLQAKLLRAIQEREIDRVGGTQPIKVDIRLIATSNRDMEEEVKAKRFREDLYFRLNVVNVHMPSLRERPSDIVPLAEHFAAKYAAANGLANKPLSAGALGMLQSHHWRGNVRELENTMHRAVLLARGADIDQDAIILSSQGFAPEGVSANSISARAASATSNGSTTPANLVGRTVADVERDLIIDTLNHCLGNRTHAANILGISIRTLRNKLKQYSESGVPVPPATGDERAVS